MRNLLALALVLATSVAYSQREDVDFSRKPTFTDRLYTGGGFGFSANDSYMYIGVSPVIGYMFTSRFSGGATITYQYFSYRVPIETSSSVYGLSPFLRFNLSRQFFLTTSYNWLNYDQDIVLAGRQNRYFTRFLVGAGFAQPIGNKSAFVVMAQYDLTYANQVSSPYNSPWVISAGITAGF
jgi:hypothetical protein